MSKTTEKAKQEAYDYVCALLADRAKNFRKWQTYMGGWDEDKEAWEVAAHCCEYIAGILSSPFGPRTRGGG